MLEFHFSHWIYIFHFRTVTKTAQYYLASFKFFFFKHKILNLINTDHLQIHTKEKDFILSSHLKPAMKDVSILWHQIKVCWGLFLELCFLYPSAKVTLNCLHDVILRLSAHTWDGLSINAHPTRLFRGFLSCSLRSSGWGWGRGKRWG